MIIGIHVVYLFYEQRNGVKTISLFKRFTKSKYLRQQML